MSTIKDGGPAFPVVQTTQEGSGGNYTMNVESIGGMSLRDYFAAKAMQGYVSRNDESSWTFAEVAIDAYKQADAMLAAREAK